MKTPAEVAVEALGRLRLDELGEGKALRLLTLHGLKPQRLKSLHEEWALDVVLTKRSKVDGSERLEFQSWLEQRIRDPFRVPRHRVARVRQSWGEEMAVRAEILFWPSAQAWTRQVRKHGDDYSACLAHAWLHAGMNDSGKHFIRHATVCAQHIASGCNDLAEWTPPQDVFRLSFPLEGLPVSGWEAQAREAYGPKILQDSKRLVSLADACRTAGEMEEAKLESEDRVQSILRETPHLRITALSSAVDAGLSSDDVLTALAAFVARPPRRENGAPWHYLLARTYPAFLRSAEKPDRDEHMRRLTEVSSLDTTWTDGLPEDWKGMLDGRASSPRICSQWVQEIVEGKREPPLDPLLDYGLWLAERR